MLLHCPAGPDNSQTPFCYTATATRWQSGLIGANTMRRQATQQESFIVRIWREEHTPGWCAWVQHTRSGKTTVAHTVQELLAFLELRTGKLDDTSPQGLK
jgi:hypothetical protein